MKAACLILLLCSTLCACATPGGAPQPSLLDFDELGTHITVTREALDETGTETVASR